VAANTALGGPGGTATRNTAEPGGMPSDISVQLRPKLSET
jgi:hypothetical protein